jgi:hypothetical protein
LSDTIADGGFCAEGEPQPEKPESKIIPTAPTADILLDINLSFSKISDCPAAQHHRVAPDFKQPYSAVR